MIYKVQYLRDKRSVNTNLCAISRRRLYVPTLPEFTSPESISESIWKMQIAERLCLIGRRSSGDFIAWSARANDVHSFASSY